MSEKSNTTGGTSICGLLGVVFITLKLCGVIDWSWWLVTAPLWVGSALALAILGVWGVIMAACITFRVWQERERK